MFVFWECCRIDWVEGITRGLCMFFFWSTVCHFSVFWDLRWWEREETRQTNGRLSWWDSSWLEQNNFERGPWRCAGSWSCNFWRGVPKRERATSRWEKLLHQLKPHSVEPQHISSLDHLDPSLQDAGNTRMQDGQKQDETTKQNKQRDPPTKTAQCSGHNSGKNHKIPPNKAP